MRGEDFGERNAGMTGGINGRLLCGKGWDEGRGLWRKGWGGGGIRGGGGLCRKGGGEGSGLRGKG